MMVIEWFLYWMDCIWCWLFWVCRVSEFIWCFVVFSFELMVLCILNSYYEWKRDVSLSFVESTFCVYVIVFDEFLYYLVLFTKSLLTKSFLCFDKNNMMCIFYSQQWLLFDVVDIEYHGYYEIDIWICYVSICVILIYFDSSNLFKWLILLWRMNNVFEMNGWWSYWNLHVMI